MRRRILRIARPDGSALELERYGDGAVEVSEVRALLRHAVRIEASELASVLEALEQARAAEGGT
jgi:uncharacterized tellurite resistance protein B-like protein